MNICFVVASLNRGGAERALTHVANGLAERDHDVSVVTLKSPGPGDFTLSDAVSRTALGVTGDTRGLRAKIRAATVRIIALRRALRASRADCVVVFGDQTNVLALIAATGLGLPIVISERTHPDAHVLPRVWRWLRRLTYPRASHLVVQTRGLEVAFSAIAKVPRSVIPNPVHVPPPGPSESERVHGLRPGFRIVGLGRLSPEKGFDLLIDAMPAIVAICPQATLILHGEGGEKAALERRTAELGVGHAVTLAGFTSDVSSALRQADLFVLPSRYEGQPNAMLEAMAHGVPVVAFDCPGGVAEVAGDGRHARLVRANDVTALAAAVVEVLGSDEHRARFRDAGRAAVEPYAAERVFDTWESLLERIVGRTVPR